MNGPKEAARAAEELPGRERSHQGLTEQGDGTATRSGDLNEWFATARARLAIGGYALHLLDGGTDGALYLVHRWDRSRTLASMEAVEAFITQALGLK